MSDLSSSESSKSSSNLLLLILSIKKFSRVFKKLPRFFKKFEANFLTGLLIGAIFSLLVNILTNQIDESITRQKSLEALEIEISNQHFLNLAMINSYKKGYYKEKEVFLYQLFRYDDHVWKSLASTTFFYSLPWKTQALLSNYYQFTIERANSYFADNDKIVHEYQAKWVECVVSGRTCTAEATTLNNIVTYYSGVQYDWALSTDQSDYDIQKVFHPTRDRLNDPLLSLLMGRQALPAIALPWKPAK